MPRLVQLYVLSVVDELVVLKLVAIQNYSLLTLCFHRALSVSHLCVLIHFKVGSKVNRIIF